MLSVAWRRRRASCAVWPCDSAWVMGDICESVQEGAFQSFDQILRASEVELEEPIEHRRVLAALHQRGAQRSAECAAFFQAHQHRRASKVATTSKCAVCGKRSSGTALASL